MGQEGWAVVPPELEGLKAQEPGRAEAAVNFAPITDSHGVGLSLPRKSGARQSSLTEIPFALLTIDL